ncbi:MAG: hypothetical protein ACM3P1_06135 [Candidatus Saccharibacteria bacterium]
MELSTNDKKVALEVIEIGLQNEFKNNLLKFSRVLKEWEEKPVDNNETYYKLYKKVIKFEKHLAHRYDGMNDSKYILIIAAQLVDGVISKEDLEPFSEEVKQRINNIINI